MTGLRPVVVVGLILALLAASLQDVQGEEQVDQVPSEVQCRPYIEKALKDRETGTHEDGSKEEDQGSEGEGDVVSQEESVQEDEPITDGSQEIAEGESIEKTENEKESTEAVEEEAVTEEESDEAVEESKGDDESIEEAVEESKGDESIEKVESVEATDSVEDQNVETAETDADEKSEADKDDASGEVKSEESLGNQVEEKSEETVEVQLDENEVQSTEVKEGEEEEAHEASEQVKSDEAFEEVVSETEVEPETAESVENVAEESIEDKTAEETEPETGEDSVEKTTESVDADQAESAQDEGETEGGDGSVEMAEDSKAEEQSVEEVIESIETQEAVEETVEQIAEETEKTEEISSVEQEKDETKEEDKESAEKAEEAASEAEESREKRDVSGEESVESKKEATVEEQSAEQTDDTKEEKSEEEEAEPTPEEDLIQEIEIPENLRPREHINQILRLDQDNEEKEAAIAKAADVILKELKRLYDTAIKPLETLYKYRDLSNRHFGDSEIFSKPLVLFMGPWSGGKSSIINYLLDIEYTQVALRTGAEPSPAYFNILMHGEEEEVLDGTQLAADWTFSGLQKFGQGLLDRLRGLRLNNKLLEKVNIVEIPGILEIRKQVQRLFPFNDACQWFIDRADIIFLVYDPSKLDVGPETEAILDQLKGREYQTRIILNKADQVKPEELMRVQGALIWNISPLMSSAEPPIMYSTSLWSMPYEAGAPTRLLYAQERAFLRDLRSAVDKRVEHKIASARRFAVRVRNHAKMVDCYLTTYYNHKTFFGGKKEISDRIIENPQEYHIYEGLSTLTNISRYDLPDPDVYRDFFRLNSLYDFPLLSSTCTYFRGCPINRLDVAIAYDLPELVGKYKKMVEAAMHEEGQSPS